MRAISAMCSATSLRRRASPCGVSCTSERRRSAVVGVARDKACTLCAVHELHRAVVAQNHALGEIGDGRLLPFRQGSNDLHQLILLGLDTCALRRGLAEAEKRAQLIAELREIGEARDGLEGSLWRHGSYLYLIVFRRIRAPSRENSLTVSIHYRLEILNDTPLHPSGDGQTLV